MKNCVSQKTDSKKYISQFLLFAVTAWGYNQGEFYFFNSYNP